MADGGGFGSKMGVVALGSWAAGYSAPTALVPFLKEDMSAAFDRLQDESLVGSASRGPGAQGRQLVQGETEHNLDYNNFDLLFEWLCGANASRVFTIVDTDLPKWGGFEIDKVIQRHRFYPAKIGKVTIAGRANGIVTVKFGWMVKQRVMDATAFPAISTTGPRNLVLFKHLLNAFWIGDQADALTLGNDALAIDSFELTFDRQMKGDDNDSASPTYSLEPIPGDWRACNLKITTARYNTASSALTTWKDNDTALQIRMLFTGGSETFKIELPEVRITEGFDVPVGGPGPLKQEGTFQASPSSAGNPMYVGNEVRFTFT